MADAGHKTPLMPSLRRAGDQSRALPQGELGGLFGDRRDFVFPIIAD
jgi:hypothetical protein